MYIYVCVCEYMHICRYSYVCVPKLDKGVRLVLISSLGRVTSLGEKQILNTKPEENL